jgi:hypothetical protein
MIYQPIGLKQQTAQDSICYHILNGAALAQADPTLADQKWAGGCFFIAVRNIAHCNLMLFGKEKRSCPAFTRIILVFTQ